MPPRTIPQRQYIRSAANVYLANVDEFITSIDSTINTDEVFAYLQKYTERLGFESYAYEILYAPNKSINPIFATSYPKDWIEHYIENRYCRDDLISRFSMQQVTPFLWDDLFNKQPLTERQTKMLQESIVAGIKIGASVPIHGPGPIKGYLVVANSTDIMGFNNLFEDKRHELQIIASYAHEKIVEHLQNGSNLLGTKLTPREIEILTWTAIGKTSWEISEILNIAHSTVRKHIDNICHKLGVGNKTHAVAVGLINGFIGL
jgi:LuxR family transcriptional regulator, activator of conjugal transfer of Ti plasmids